MCRLRLHLEHARLGLLRGFDQLLCLEGLTGVEHFPHQIETVRKVLRHFRGRVLLADEVGLGKTIEACLLLREYLLRGLVKRVLILVPTPLVSQWQEELRSKFDLEFSIPPRTGEADRPDYWAGTDRVLASLSFAKSQRRAEAVAAAPWDLVIVDEAHHCKNRATRNWQLVNALKRRHLFLLTATPVQNNLLELYNLLTLLEPGHLKTEIGFQAAVRPPRQSPRSAEPRAAAVAVGRGDGPQHAEPGADGPAAPLRPDADGPAARRRGAALSRCWTSICGGARPCPRRTRRRCRRRRRDEPRPAHGRRHSTAVRLQCPAATVAGGAELPPLGRKQLSTLAVGLGQPSAVAGRIAGEDGRRRRRGRR